MLCTIYSKTIRSKKEKTSILGLEELATLFQTDERKRKTVEAFRAELPTLPPSWHWRGIHQLPLICPGLLQKIRRNGELQTTYNGVVLLEVSGLTRSADIERVKMRVAGWPTTLAAFTGASGQSVKILVSGTLDDGSLPNDVAEHFHQALYETCAAAYASLIGHPLKPKNAHVRDTFRWTYDPTPFINPQAQPIRIPRRELLRVAGNEGCADTLEYGPNTALPSPETNCLYRRRFALAVSKAKEEGTAEGLPLLEATAIESLRLNIPQEEAVRQAIRNPLFYEIDRHLTRTTIESIYLENASKAGRNRSYRMQEAAFSLQEFIRIRYDLRFNELTNGVEWRRNDSATPNFQPLDSRMTNTMIQEAHEFGLEVHDRDMRRYLGSTRVRSYNAARAYLHSINEKWDGRTDYIGALADRVPTSSPLWRESFHTWFLGMVAQWEGWDPMHGNAVVPMLIATQDCGKDAFGQLLLPPALCEVGYQELMDIRSKSEVDQMMTTTLLISFNEFSQFNEKFQQYFLKELIQKTGIKGRRPYSNETIQLPRFASFIATTKNANALAGSSGSRRFLIAEIRDGASIDTTTPLPYSQLYAQALAELSSGRLHYFTPERLAALEAYNARYTESRMEVVRFLDTFEPLTDVKEGAVRLKLSDIAEAVRKHTGYFYSDKSFNYLGRWLTSEAKALRIRKTMSNGCPMYLLRYRHNK